jgi:hypothetical protein
MDYIRLKRLEDQLHAAEECGLDELREFERNVLRKERDKASHQYEGLNHHRQEEVSILPSGFNIQFEQALAASKNELDELIAMDEEAKQKLGDIEDVEHAQKKEALTDYYLERQRQKRRT